jgi:outer membrane usher protein
VSVYGTMLDSRGRPLALLTGVARPAGRGGKRVVLFTNQAGRFGAEGLAPGRWVVEMQSDDGPVHYVIDVPADAVGLVKAGTLAPSEEI